MELSFFYEFVGVGLDVGEVVEGGGAVGEGRGIEFGGGEAFVRFIDLRQHGDGRILFI